MKNLKLQIKIKQLEKALRSEQKFSSFQLMLYNRFFYQGIRNESSENSYSSPRFLFIENWKLKIGNYRQNGGLC